MVYSKQRMVKRFTSL